jgi:hypothetical protein
MHSYNIIICRYHWSLWHKRPSIPILAQLRMAMGMVDDTQIDRDCPYCYKDRCVHADAIVRTPPACYGGDCPLMAGEEIQHDSSTR